MSKNVNSKKGGGIGAGFLLLLVGIGLLWYNEGRTVKNQSTINEARKQYIQVKSDILNDKNEGKLVATKGSLNISESNELVDTIFGVSIKAVKMDRTVEVYQWKESCETDKNDKKTCTYEKVWSSSLIDSSDFNDSEHTNPDNKLYDSESFIADRVLMGAYVLPTDLVKKLASDKSINNDVLVSKYTKTVEGYSVSNNYITNVKDNNPEIGDIRISYKYIDSGDVSVMAVQTGNSFEAFTSKKGGDVYRILKGNYTGAQMLEQMTKSNKTWKWILRFVGVLVIISAFNSMFSWLTNLTVKIPVLGAIVGGATNLVATILGLSLSLIIIAIAWFRYRPILSLVLLIIVLGLVFGLRVYGKNKPSDK